MELTLSYDIENWSRHGNPAIREAPGKKIAPGQLTQRFWRGWVTPDNRSHPLPLRLSWDGWEDADRPPDERDGDPATFGLVPPLCSAAFHAGVVLLLAALLHLSPLRLPPPPPPVIQVVFVPPPPEPAPPAAAAASAEPEPEPPAPAQPQREPPLSPAPAAEASPPEPALPPRPPPVAEAPPPEPVPVPVPPKPVVRPPPKPVVHKPPPKPPPHPFPAPPRVVPPQAAATTPAASPQTAAVPIPAPAPAPPAPVITAAYRDALAAWLNSHKHYPERARQRGEEGRAVVRFRIDRSGRVLNFALLSSTGHADLDAALDEMMRGAAMPPFPADMAASEIDVTLTIRFGLSR